MTRMTTMVVTTMMVMTIVVMMTMIMVINNIHLAREATMSAPFPDSS